MVMKLLVAVDSSECCKEAVKHLRMSGIAMGAKVRFVHVMKVGQNAKDVSPGLVEVTSLLTNAASVETIYAEGEPAQRLCELAAEWESDMIAMGTSDKTGLERLMLGSVAKSVLSKADCPVLIIRGNASSMNNILVAADDSESSAASIEWLSNQSWARHKNLALLTVMNEPPVSLESEFGSVESASESLLRKQLEEARVSQLSQSWSDLCAANLHKPQIPFVVTDGVPSLAILELSKNWPVDLIVLGSHCRSGIDKLLHGSVSEAVADKAGCSVLVVRDVVATRFEEIRLSIAASAKLSAENLKSTHKARVSTSLTVNDFKPHFPASF
jgi:nucleotide-binding universal stress UspA family protein